MRIAILGTRGIPANYGGFETFAEHLSTRLAARGHDVTVYCRAHYTSPRQIEYQGVRLKVLPTIRHKYFDTIVHTFLSALHAMPRRYDAALICNAANAPFASILRLTGTPVALNVDGLEHKRKKWNSIARRYYLMAERLATILPNETVTDARVIQEYYLALQQNAYCYIHATEVGGTHPALLEAMGFGNCVLTLAAPENIEAIGDAGIAYADEKDLAEKLQRVLRDGSLVHSYRNRAQARVQEKYDWDYVVDQYERLFARMAGAPVNEPDRLASVESPVSQTRDKSLSRSAGA